MRIVFSVLVCSLFFVACTNNTKPAEETAKKESVDSLAVDKPLPRREEQIKYIQQIERRLYNATDVFDAATANSIINIYNDFVTNYPKDSLVPDYLFKLGEVCMALKKSQMGVDYLIRLNNDFPNDSKAMQALFMAAFITDDQLNDEVKAKELYNKFLEKYPNSTMVKDVKACIANLGKSDADLIKEFERKNKKK